MGWWADLGLKIWSHSDVAGAFFLGLSAAGIARWQAMHQIAEAKRLSLAESKALREQILLDLKISRALRLNGHAGTGDGPG